MTNLACSLSEAAQLHPKRTALRLDETTISYAELDKASAHMAGALVARGVLPGDRVGLMVPNVPAFVIAYYGILRAGGVVVPMNVLLKEREATFYLQDPGADLVVAWHDFAAVAEAGAAATGASCLLVKPVEFEAMLADSPALDEPVERADDDTAVILYTSGTTGTPKGAELTHSNLRRNVEVVLGLVSLTADDVILGAPPLFHSFGQTVGMNSAIAAGACLSLLPRFEPGKAVQMFGRDGVTIFIGVPTMYGAMLHDPGAADADTSALRLTVSGGASLPVELMKAFETQFGCKVLEGYGLSETSPVASYNHADRERKPGSIGTPVAGVEMRLVDDAGQDSPTGEIGEIVIRGHNVMKGYWNRADATADAIRNSWFHTGDLATVDDDGYFFIVDRKKDLIIRGGYNVYPREIEEVLYEHPAVREAAVLGVPHPELGEEVGAAVALKAGHTTSADELRAFVKDKVAAYKYPRRVWFVDELPKGPSGKILKRSITVDSETDVA